MNRFRWRRVAVVVCLISCFVISAVAGAKQDKTDQTVQDDVGSTEKQESADMGVAELTIDNRHVYKGMDASYARGYVPKVKKNKVVLVLPLRAKQKLARKQMTVSVAFGGAESEPFVYKNYEKTVSFGYHKTAGRSGKKGCYLVSFALQLKKERVNGSYPVTLSVRAEDEMGNEIRQDFTVYVTITDGKNAGAETAQGERQEEVPQFAPKVMIDSYRFSKKHIMCGEKVTAKVTLHNTSSSEPVKNMLVSVAPGENVELLGKTASRYVERLGAGKTVTLSFDFRVSAGASRGQYNIDVTIDYSDKKANSYTAQGAIKVLAEQPVQIEIAQVPIPDKIQVGETVELQAQAMNLGKGKIYNVRAVLEAEGLTPSGTAFIGDMEPGTSMVGSMELTADGLSGDSLYGTAQGKITFFYEDEAGNEMTQEQQFETSILSPFSEENGEEKADDTKQWWVIMAVITFLLVQAAVVFFMRKAKNVPTKEGEGA